MRLENWLVTGTADPYLSPELQRKQISGEVYGHPTRPNGRRILTSAILRIDGNVITTGNSVYTLGEPDPVYVEWCRENGHHVPTPEQPIKA